MLPMNTFFQIAYVTRNLDKAMASFDKSHGTANWIVFEPETEVHTPQGSGLAKLRAGLVWAGGLQIELIEPISGLVDIYKPNLPPGDDGVGFHHVCARTDDPDGVLAQAKRDSITVAYRGGVPGLDYLYLDTRKTLGHYLEYIWATPEMWAATGYPGQAT